MPRRPLDSTVIEMAHSQRLNKSVRTKLITLLPRLHRFALTLAGNRESADALLRAACNNMLDGGAVSRQGLAFDVWAFGALQGEWLAGLRTQTYPISQGQGDVTTFLPVGAAGEDRQFRDIAGVLSKLPPQQRSAVLLVYGEGFSYAEAAQILETPLDTVIARVSRALGAFITRAGPDDTGPVAANVEQLQQINRQAG